MAHATSGRDGIVQFRDQPIILLLRLIASMFSLKTENAMLAGFGARESHQKFGASAPNRPVIIWGKHTATGIRQSEEPAVFPSLKFKRHVPLLYNQTRCIAMRQQVQSETLAYAIAYLESRGFSFGVHFVESTAEALAGEIALLRGFSARTPE